MRIKQSILICFGMALVLMTAGTATAATITANNSTGPAADFTSIQAAIDDVNTLDGDTILVYPGTYIENVNVNKELIIISESGNPANTIIHAANSNDHVFHVTAPSVWGFSPKISGFNIMGASGAAGIYLDYYVSSWTISNNTISNNNKGISLAFSGRITLINNTLTDNTMNGIDSAGCRSLEIIDNTILNST